MDRKVYLVLLAMFFVFPLSLAQVTPFVTEVSAPTAFEKAPITLSVTLERSQGVERVVLFYRSFGESEFRDAEMLLAGRTATIGLPASTAIRPFLEYYVSIDMADGTRQTHPIQSPEAAPLRLTINPLTSKDSEVRMLTPEPGETLAIEDLAIAISLFYTSDQVDRSKTRLFLDRIDVSGQSVFLDDMVIYSPKNFSRPLNPGAHFVRVELYDAKGTLYHAFESSFNLSSSRAISAEQGRLRAGVSGQIELRNEDLSVGSTSYARADLRLNGTYRAMSFGSNVYLDNQDRAERQPQNRYSLFGQTDFLRLQVGDSYPRFPSLIMSGKRIRGFSGNLALGFFNLDVTSGEGTRGIEGLVDSVSTVDSSRIPALPINTRSVGGLKYEFFSRGVYSRDFFAIRPSFGSGENFQLGFTYMKAKDDIASIRYGVTPQENLSIGTDLLIAFDNQRLKFEGQAAFTLNNTDISSGNFTDADYDSIEALNESAGKALKAIRPFAESIITINKNIFPTNPVGEGLPGISFEGLLTLNYLNNYVQAMYFRRGAAYRTLGNEFLQTDIAGFLVSDRIRMFENRAFLTLAYEKKSDNTANTKQATTTYSNLSTSLTVTPLRLPTFTIGYGIYGRESDDQVTRPLLLEKLATERRKSADDKTERIFVGTSYDFILGARQSFMLNANISSREDNTFYNRDQKNLYLSTTLTSRYAIPLQTTIGLNFNKNQNDLTTFTGSGLVDVRDTTLTFDFATLLLGAQYRLFGDQLRLLTMVAPSFGELKRISLQLGVDYVPSQQHMFELMINYIGNTDFKNDFIAGIVYRFNF